MRNTIGVTSLLALLMACGNPTSTGSPVTTVATVTLSQSTATLIPGATLQLTATPKDGAGSPVSGEIITWSTGAPNVATVSSSGLVTAVTAGTATITAAIAGKSADAIITVQNPVASVALSQRTATLIPATTVQLTATPLDGAGNPVSGQTVVWSSSAPTIATVSLGGLVTAIAVGTTTVTATSSGKSAAATIAVVPGSLIGAAGGTVTSADGNVSVVIPAGALAQPTPITIAPAAIIPASAVVVAGSAYNLGPSGTQFAQPVMVTIKYDPAAVATGTPQEALGLYTAGATSWSAIAGGTVDTVAHTVQGSTTHFSEFSAAAPGVILTIFDADNGGLRRWIGSLKYQGTLTLCVASGQTYSIAIGLDVLDPTLPQATPAVSSSNPSVADAAGASGGQLNVTGKGVNGSTKLTVDYDNVVLLLNVVATSDSPPCSVVAGVYTREVTSTDQVWLWNGVSWFNVAAPAGTPALRPNALPGLPGVSFHQTQGANTLLRYLYVAGAAQAITLATTTGIFWGETFLDGTSLLFSEEPAATPGLAELYKIRRDGTGRVPFTNLGQYVGPSSAAQNGKVYAAWAVNRNVATQIVELSAQGSVLRTLTAAGPYRWRPAISQNSRYLAYEQYSADFSSEQLFVMDLNNPAALPVAASPATGSGLSASWCGNDYLYFAYTTVAFEGSPYQVMRWSRATGAITAVPLLAGYSTPQLAIQPTWGITAPLLCP